MITPVQKCKKLFQLSPKISTFSYNPKVACSVVRNIVGKVCNVALLASTLTLVRETSGGLDPSGEGLRVGGHTQHIERLSSVLGQ